ncbi:cytochrome P450 alkane hydroxylase protein [Rutstroemia sp. NJR-2017a WRK4]|nr:cytochrome P450 alkane hydroxylase protein [Rutstroemia sp. NJR-2017a WRK4]
MSEAISHTMNTIIWITIPFIAYKIYSRYITYRADQEFGKSHGCLPPPRVPARKFLGRDRLTKIFEAASESRLMEYFWSVLKENGMTVDHVTLAKHSFSTIEPENIQCLLSGKFEDYSFGTRKQLMYALLGDGIFVQEGPEWKHSRELLRPQFNFREYGDLAHFSGPMEDLLRCISTTLMDPTSNRVVDLQPLFFRYTLDTTTSFLFGKSIESLKSGDKAVKFEEAFNVAQTFMAKRFRVAAFWRLVGGKELRDACKLVHDFTDEIIERVNEHNGARDEDKDDRYVFLDKVAKEIPDQIMETLSGKETLNRNDLRQVKYLTDVLKETLRLYPSVPLNMKTAVRTTCLPTGGGPDRKSPVLVKKGEDVSFSPYSLHRRKDFYGEDAEEFRPESLETGHTVPDFAFNLLTRHFPRWQEDLPLFRDELTKTWGYLPFNGGPRICLGMDFAMTEAAYAVVKILQRYPNMTLPPHEKVVKTGQEKQAITLVIAPEEGCRVVFDDRF